LVLALVLTNGWWLYTAFDWASYEKYRQQTAYEREHQVETLAAIVDHYVRGSSADALRARMDGIFPDADPFEKAGAIHYPWVSFPVTSAGVVEGVTVGQ
jgi:hypothetical protein